jgi:glycosyltransferase involved in cell wall biosynthesis
MSSPGKVPEISIVVPVFNRLRYLQDAVASIFAQTFEDWELLIADDGSDRPTQAYLQELASRPRVQVIRLSHTGNPGVVRNAALAVAQGRYVTFLDSDDVWTADKLQRQWTALEARGDCEWSYSTFLLVDEALRIGDGRIGPSQSGRILEPLVAMEALIATSTVMIRRTALALVGTFDPRLSSCEDYDLWLRLAAHGPVVALGEPLLHVRRHREHHGTDVMAFEGRRAALEKLTHRAEPRLAALIRLQRAQIEGRLVEAYVVMGERRAALSALLASFPRSWRYAGWWSRVLRAAVRCAPKRITDGVRRLKAAARNATS